MNILKRQQSEPSIEESSLMEMEDSQRNENTEVHKQAEKILMKLIETQTQLHAGIQAVKTMEPTAMEASLLLDLNDLA